MLCSLFLVVFVQFGKIPSILSCVVLTIIINLSTISAMSSAYFQKWDPCVQRQVQKSCALCGKDFSFVRREHQCKRCLRAVCSDCSGNKITVYKQGLERKAHRGCKVCAQQQRENTELIEANRLQFARMSPLGTKWLAKLQKKGLSASIDNRKHKKFTRQVFARMWDSYNYSLREFIGMLTADLDQDEIYRNVNDVVATVVSTVPQEDLESVAYLAIFLLCFCSPDKAPFICLHLLELKASVTNYEGLLQAYLKAVGVGEGAQEKLKDYQRFRVRRFIGALSVNSVSAKTSLDVLQRILSKKRIDELYIQLALSLQMLRDSILARKDNLPYCDLLMVRMCTPQATNSKGKLPALSAVKSANFMRERNEYEQEQRGSSFMHNESSMTRGQKDKQAMAASFSEGIRGKDNRAIMQSPPNPEPQYYKEAPSIAFKKRMDLREDSFIEDSFSVISMIDQMNQVSNKNGRGTMGEGNQLLQLMNQEKSNDSLEIKREVYGTGEKPVGFPQLNLSLGEAVVESTKNKRPMQCQKCISNNRTLAAVMRELQQMKQQKQRQEDNFKRQLKSLQDRLKSTSSKENQSIAFEKLEYQTQIRKLRQTIMEYEHRDRQNQASLARMQQLKKQVVRLQLQLKAVNHQLSESATTTKMLRNKLEMQSLSIPQGRPTEAADALKVNEILKKSLFEKNQQIEELSKKNKLIQYQLEEMAKERMQDKERAELRQRTGKLEKEKEELLAKMKELSNLLMEMQSQKLNLSEQVFDLKQALRGKGVVFSRS